MTVCKICACAGRAGGNYCQPCIDGVVARALAGESMRSIGGDLGMTRNQVVGLFNRNKPPGTASPSAPRTSMQTRRNNQDRTKVEALKLDDIAKTAAVSPQEPVGCLWIDGDVIYDKDWGHCQRKREKPSSYCAFHRALSVDPDRPAKRKYTRRNSRRTPEQAYQ